MSVILIPGLASSQVLISCSRCNKACDHDFPRVLNFLCVANTFTIMMTPFVLQLLRPQRRAMKKPGKPGKPGTVNFFSAFLLSLALPFGAVSRFFGRPIGSGRSRRPRRRSSLLKKLSEPSGRPRCVASRIDDNWASCCGCSHAESRGAAHPRRRFEKLEACQNPIRSAVNGQEIDDCPRLRRLRFPKLCGFRS